MEISADSHSFLCEAVNFLILLAAVGERRKHSESSRVLTSSAIGTPVFWLLYHLSSSSWLVILGLDFTPRKARKSRQYWYLCETKLTKNYHFEEQMLKLFQIRLVYAQKSYINCGNLFKIGLIWSYCVFYQTFYPNL